MKQHTLPSWELKLKGGTRLTIRPITLSDQTMEKAFFEQLSQESRHYRFLGGVSELSSQTLAKLCDMDYCHDMAFLAVINSGKEEQIIGVVRYAEDPKSPHVAELAVTVADDWQHQGIATELLTRLIQYAQSKGIKKIYSVDSYANRKMQQLASDFGFKSHPDPDDSTQVIYEIDIS
ncbi:GNAT family N-acetyltransferase [Marinicella sediminis]|uniref:GNAT family N-acetyltransferase n=1 Tax=Marinicella sediminis TaxID=1792834 RepID=A0ABV7JCP3_9GAMM|nr:GNAT family N-acetyltransferase [Marinicella sediminis]